MIIMNKFCSLFVHTTQTKKFWITPIAVLRKFSERTNSLTFLRIPQIVLQNFKTFAKKLYNEKTHI